MSYEYYLVCNCLVGAVVGGGAYSFVACLSHSTIDHASLSRRSTVPTPNRDTNIWALITFFSIYYIETFCLSHPLPVSPSVATICGEVRGGKDPASFVGARIGAKDISLD